MNREEEIHQLKTIAEISGIRPAEFVLPESHQVIVGNIRLHYLEWGNVAKPPILFLHGGGLNAHTWDMVCLMLRDRYHCVALDQRGHGDSEWAPDVDYRTPTQTRDVEGFVRLLGLRRPVLVGQSMGGQNSLTYGGRHSDEIAGLCIVDVGPEISMPGSARIRDFTSAAQEDSIEVFLKRAMEFNPLRDPVILRRSLHYNLRQLPNGKWTWKHDAKRRAESPPAETVSQRSEALWESVDRIGCPTLIVRGSLSDVFSDEQAENLTRRLRQGRWVRVENAGHNVQGDNPAGLLAALGPFLKEVLS